MALYTASELMSKGQRFVALANSRAYTTKSASAILNEATRAESATRDFDISRPSGSDLDTRHFPLAYCRYVRTDLILPCNYVRTDPILCLTPFCAWHQNRKCG